MWGARWLLGIYMQEQEEAEAGLGRGRSWTVTRAQQNLGPSGKKLVLWQTEMIGHCTPTWFSHLTQAPRERARPPTEEAILPLKQTVKLLPAEGCGLTAFPAARRQALPWRGSGWCISLPTRLPTSPQLVNKDWFYFNFFQQRKGIIFSYIQCWIWNYHYNFYSIDCQVVSIIFLGRLKLPAHSSIYLRNIF